MSSFNSSCNFIKNIHTLRSISAISFKSNNFIKTLTLKKNFNFTNRTLGKQWPVIKSSMGDLDGNSNKNYRKQKKADRKYWEPIKRNVYIIGLGGVAAVCGVAMIYKLGQPKIDEYGKNIEDEFSALPLILQFFLRSIVQIKFYNKMLKEPSPDKLLPDPLSFPQKQPPYTLVLEMKDVLLHPEWTIRTGWKFKKRPGVEKFLKEVSERSFEVVVFTTEQGENVSPILDTLDPNGNIRYRLFRDSTDFIDGHQVKNLNYLNRDLKKVIVVDCNPDSVKLHRDNLLIIPRWRGNEDDTTLDDLAELIKTMAGNEIENVQDVLKYYQQFENPIAVFKENQRKLELEKEKEKQKNTGPLSFTSKWSSGFIKKLF